VDPRVAVVNRVFALAIQPGSAELPPAAHLAPPERAPRASPVTDPRRPYGPSRPRTDPPSATTNR